MSLNFSNLPATYKWPVQFTIPGVAKQQSFVAEFRRLGGARIKEIISMVKNSTKIREDEDDEPEYDELEMMLELMENWEAKDDKTDEAIPFGPEILAELIEKLPKFPGEVMAAFISSTYSGKAKNSKAP